MILSELWLGGGILWEKEKPWVPIKGPIFRSGKYDRPIYFYHELNDYCPISIIEFRLNSNFAKNNGKFSIEFFGVYNKQNNEITSKNIYDEKNQIFQMIFDEPVFTFNELYLNNVYISQYTDKEAEKILGLQFRVIK